MRAPCPRRRRGLCLPARPALLKLSIASFGLLETEGIEKPAPCRSLLLSFGLRGKRNRAGRALAWDARQLDLSTMRGNNRLGDAQTESSAAFLTAPRFINSVKAVEHPGEVLRRNADARVAKSHDRGLALRFDPDNDLAALGRVLDGVVQQ